MTRETLHVGGSRIRAVKLLKRPFAANEFVAMAIGVSHGTKSRTRQWLGLQGIRNRSVDFIEPLRIGRNVNNPKIAWGFSMNRQGINLVFEDGSVCEQFLKERCNQMLAEHFD